MTRKYLFTSALIVLVFALAACGGSEAAEQLPPTQVIEVDMNDIYFGGANDNVDNPPVWRVSSGSEVTIRMNNMGALEHNWAILRAGEDIPVPFVEADHADKVLFSAGVVAAGADDEATFSTPAPGEYRILCTVPGHSGLMQGQLIVES